MLTKVYLQTWEYESFKTCESWYLEGRLIQSDDYIIEVMVPDEWIKLQGSAYGDITIEYRR